MNKQSEKKLQEVLAKKDKLIARLKTNAKPLHEILVIRREELCLERKDIVNLTGLSVATISRLENGQLEDIKVSSLKKLSQAYGVDQEMMLLGIARDLDSRDIEKKRDKISKSRLKIKSMEEEIEF